MYNVLYLKSQIFIVKIFSDSMSSAKIKQTDIMRIINANAARGRLSENYLTRKLIARNITDLLYTVVQVTILI